jgi:hypothetical protein
MQYNPTYFQKKLETVTMLMGNKTPSVMTATTVTTVSHLHQSQLLEPCPDACLGCGGTCTPIQAFCKSKTASALCLAEGPDKLGRQFLLRLCISCTFALISVGGVILLVSLGWRQTNQLLWYRQQSIIGGWWQWCSASCRNMTTGFSWLNELEWL